MTSSTQGASGKTRCRKSACAKPERRRGKRRREKSSDPSGSTMRGATAPTRSSSSSADASASSACGSIRASGLRKSTYGIASGRSVPTLQPCAKPPFVVERDRLDRKRPEHLDGRVVRGVVDGEHADVIAVGERANACATVSALRNVTTTTSTDVIAHDPSSA